MKNVVMSAIVSIFLFPGASNALTDEEFDMYGEMCSAAIMTETLMKPRTYGEKEVINVPELLMNLVEMDSEKTAIKIVDCLDASLDSHHRHLKEEPRKELIIYGKMNLLILKNDILSRYSINMDSNATSVRDSILYYILFNGQ